MSDTTNDTPAENADTDDADKPELFVALPLRGRTLEAVVNDMMSRRRSGDTSWAILPSDADPGSSVTSPIIQAGTRCVAAVETASRNSGGKVMLWGTDRPGIRFTTRNAMIARRWLNGQFN